jgi:hypothetical protein
LSVVSQFWRRLTGSYQILSQEFRVLALPREKKSDPNRPNLSGIKVDETPLEKLSPEELKARKEEWKRRKISGGVGSKKTTEAVPVKQYSEGERNKAWKGFHETIIKKE